MAAFFFRKGTSSKIGLPPVISMAVFLAASIFSSSITRGMIRVPASLSPAFTGTFPCREAIIIWPMLFTALRASFFILNRPLHAAVSSIFPSLGAERSMYSPLQMAQRISAASSS